MLQKRLWTALLALMAVVGMAGGALANPGDATIGFTFSNPADILDINFLVYPNPYKARLEAIAAGNPVDTTNHPNFNAQWNATAETGTAVISWPTALNFQNIATENSVAPNFGAIYSVLQQTNLHEGALTAALKYGEASSQGRTMSISVSNLDDVQCTGYWLSAGDPTDSMYGDNPLSSTTMEYHTLADPISPMNPMFEEVWYGTIYLVFESTTTPGTGFYIPVRFMPYQTGIINLTTDEGNSLITGNSNEFPQTASLPGGYSEPLNNATNACTHYPDLQARVFPERPLMTDSDSDGVDDDVEVSTSFTTEAGNNMTVMDALRTELEDYALTLRFPHGGTGASLTMARAHAEDQGVVPGNLKYVENGVLKTLNFNNSGTITGLRAGTYYLQVNIQQPNGWAVTNYQNYDPSNPWAPAAYSNSTKTVYRVQLNVVEDGAAVSLTAPTTATAGTAAVFSFTATDSNGDPLSTTSAPILSATATIGSTAQTATVAMTENGRGTVTVTPSTAGTLSVTLTLADHTTATATGTVTVAAATTGGESGSGTGTGGESGSGTGTGGESGSGTGTGGESGGTPVTPTKTAVTLTPATGATAPTVKAGAETTVTFTVSPDVAGKAEVKVADTSIATATAAYRTVSTAAASGGTVSVAVKGVKAGMTKATLTFTPTDSTRYTAPAAVTLNITVTASGSSSEPDGPTSDKDSDTEKKAEAILENLDTSTPGGAAMAEKLSNPEDKAAAVDAVEALERAGTDVSALSSKDVEALVQNKKAEEADKEVEKSGSVSDPTVPAASELLDSATALSVSPKVVKPTPVTEEAVLADMKTGIENFTAEKDSGVDSSAVTAAKEGLQTADKIDIADAATSLTEQTKVVEDLFNMVSADLTKFGSNGVVIATVLPKMTPKASGFFPLSVNLRHLTPGRVLRFWLSPAAFTKKATGSVSVAEATEGQYFFLDENGVPTSVVTGDPAKMKLVVYLTAVQSASLAADQPVEGAFITVDGTPDDKTTLEEMTKSDSSGEGGEGGGNSDGPTSNKGSGGCDALSGGLALLALIPLFMRKRS